MQLNLARVFRDDPEMSSLASSILSEVVWSDIGPFIQRYQELCSMTTNIKKQRCMRRSKPTSLSLSVILLAKILEWPELVYNTVTGTLRLGGLTDYALTTE